MVVFLWEWRVGRGRVVGVVLDIFIILFSRGCYVLFGYRGFEDFYIRFVKIIFGWI